MEEDAAEQPDGRSAAACAHHAHSHVRSPCTRIRVSAETAGVSAALNLWRRAFGPALLLDKIRVLETVSCRDKPAAGDERGAAHVAIALYLEADLPRP